jgi:hypothetical protein
LPARSHDFAALDIFKGKAVALEALAGFLLKREK